MHVCINIWILLNKWQLLICLWSQMSAIVSLFVEKWWETDKTLPYWALRFVLKKEKVYDAVNFTNNINSAHSMFKNDLKYIFIPSISLLTEYVFLLWSWCFKIHLTHSLNSELLCQNNDNSHKYAEILWHQPSAFRF